MTVHALTQRILLILALEDLVLMERAVVDRNRYGDGRPGVAVAELAGMLDRFDRLGGFDDFWMDLSPAHDRPAADVDAISRPTDANGSERFRTTAGSRLDAPTRVLRTAPNGSERLRTTAGYRWQRC